MLRQVPLQTLGALYVNDKKNQDQLERDERKQQNSFPDGVSGYGRSVRLAPGQSRNGCLCVYVPLSCIPFLLNVKTTSKTCPSKHHDKVTLKRRFWKS